MTFVKQCVSKRNSGSDWITESEPGCLEVISPVWSGLGVCALLMVSTEFSFLEHSLLVKSEIMSRTLQPCGVSDVLLKSLPPGSGLFKEPKANELPDEVKDDFANSLGRQVLHRDLCGPLMPSVGCIRGDVFQQPQVRRPPIAFVPPSPIDVETIRSIEERMLEEHLLEQVTPRGCEVSIDRQELRGGNLPAHLLLIFHVDSPISIHRSSSPFSQSMGCIPMLGGVTWANTHRQGQPQIVGLWKTRNSSASRFGYCPISLYRYQYPSKRAEEQFERKSFEQRGCKTQSQASGIGSVFMLGVSHDDVPMVESEISGGFWTRTRTTPETSQQVPREFVTYARDRRFEREVVTDERDIFREALRHGMSETTYVKVPATFLGGCCLRRVPNRCRTKARYGGLFAAAETIHAEKEILRRMEQGQNRAAPSMAIHDAVAHSDKHQRLTTADCAAPRTPRPPAVKCRATLGR
jgi:hypothetical protein